MSPEHRAKTFLDGAVAEGPVIPHPLRPESPPKLMEMIQFLPGTAGTFSHYWEDVSERLNIRACHLLYIRLPNSPALLEPPKGGTGRQPYSVHPANGKNKNAPFDLKRRALPSHAARPESMTSPQAFLAVFWSRFPSALQKGFVANRSRIRL